MTWLILPISAIVTVLCIVVKGYTDKQKFDADMEWRKKHSCSNRDYNVDDNERRVFEFETTDHQEII